MHISELGYSASEVANATGASPGDLQNWLKRGVVVGERDQIEGGGSPGKHRRFSIYAVMQIAVAKALIDTTSGMDLKIAFGAAVRFAHLGETKAEWVGEPDEGKPDRRPGHPFHYAHGDTFLTVCGERSTVVLVPKGADTYAEMHLAMGGLCEGMVSINLTRVFGRVCRSLGINDFDLLDATYPAEVARPGSGAAG